MLKGRPVDRRWPPPAAGWLGVALMPRATGANSVKPAASPARPRCTRRPMPSGGAMLPTRKKMASRVGNQPLQVVDKETGMSPAKI